MPGMRYDFRNRRNPGATYFHTLSTSRFECISQMAMAGTSPFAIMGVMGQK